MDNGQSWLVSSYLNEDDIQLFAGRVGYGASLEGTVGPFSGSKFNRLKTHQWPYSYDSCDVGTMPNQTLNGAPAAAVTNGDPYNGNVLSYLPGQRLSRCTCKGESHPGPVHSDGTYVGRSAPEIDIFESLVRTVVCFIPISFSAVVGRWYPSARSSLPVCAVGCE